ncbi:hypothetical protein CWE08_01620 [Aliidiomarina iranensis]|uniref:Uncharacterized protein n=1 Tax=Aliidiomarina iranensis TaxID=1434071 RepID=A0A432W2E0_9GAMM|nr:hypothetical protein [Aliidiomarina iranensis]RUO23374.1 hypothetical protein CWE08_01620 [Aliidiomarina iranensis]
MFRAILTFFLGITLILLILSAISSSIQPFPLPKKALKHTQSLQLNAENQAEITVRSEQDLANQPKDSNTTTDDSNAEHHDELAVQKQQKDLDDVVANEIELLLNQEASLTNIIEANISLLGKLGSAAAFLSHQALLRKIQQTDHVQPISIICSRKMCNILVYGADPDIAENFAVKLLSENSDHLQVSEGEYRVFREEDYDFAHVVINLAEQASINE